MANPESDVDPALVRAPDPALDFALLATLGITPEHLLGRGLRACTEATELVLADTGIDGREFLLRPHAARAWQALRAAAARDGIALVLESAFRSVARQAEIVRAKLAAGDSIEAVLRLVAPPGSSEHHGGCAVDIGTPGSVALQEAFESTAAFAWLQRHGVAHGFKMSYPRGNASGYTYEPWHWCYLDSPSPGNGSDDCAGLSPPSRPRP